MPFGGVGIGCGGPMTWPQGHVSPVNIPAWRDFPLLDRMRDRYGIGLPVAIHNDAVCLALAEHRWGAGRGHENVLGMVVSTGVGGGIILGGAPHRRRRSGNAGHIGHVVVEPDGPRVRLRRARLPRGDRAGPGDRGVRRGARVAR